MVALEEIFARLKGELEPCLKAAAAQAAAREIERTREWFETRALPKAVRVAQHETYGLLRKHARAGERSRPATFEHADGRQAADNLRPSARTLTPEEVRETAEACVALLEAQGKAVEATLAEMSCEAGGWLPAHEAARVREAARLLLARNERK